MKIRLLALALVILALTGCQSDPWKEFTSPEGKFRVLLPDTPTEETRTINTELGPIDIHLFSLEGENAAYMLGYSDYPQVIVDQSEPDALLNGARDGAVSNVQGELLSELIISLNGHPGRELRIAAPDGKTTIQARIFLADARLYQIMIIVPKEDSITEDLEKFLDSFTLTGE